MENIIIAIDGPAGSGKGTLAKAFASVPFPLPAGPSMATMIFFILLFTPLYKNKSESFHSLGTK